MMLVEYRGREDGCSESSDGLERLVEAAEEIIASRFSLVSDYRLGLVINFRSPAVIQGQSATFMHGR